MLFGRKKTTPENKSKEVITPKETVVLTDTPLKNGQESALMWNNKGNALVENSMYADAIKCYDKALEINPKLPEVLNNKGLALARTERQLEAIECYDKGLEIKPGDMEIIYNKGIAL